MSYQIEDGRRLLVRLAEIGLDVVVSGWAQRSEDDRWLLILALPLVEQAGTFAGLERVLPVLRTHPPVWFTSDDLALIGPNHPQAVEMLRVRESTRGGFAGRYKPFTFGGLSIRDLYVYPERLRADLTNGQKQLLADLYARSPLTVDALPYTDEMDRIHLAFVQQTGVAVPIGELFRALLNMRKSPNPLNKPHPLNSPEPEPAASDTV